MAKRAGKSRCAVPSGCAGSSRANGSTTSQGVPRSLTPVLTIRAARFVQAEASWELGSHARLPHTEPYILFVIIFEPLIEPGSQLLARSSSTTPCPHLPGSGLCLVLLSLALPWQRRR